MAKIILAFGLLLLSLSTFAQTPSPKDQCPKETVQTVWARSISCGHGSRYNSEVEGRFKKNPFDSTWFQIVRVNCGSEMRYEIYQIEEGKSPGLLSSCFTFTVGQ